SHVPLVHRPSVGCLTVHSSILPLGCCCNYLLECHMFSVSQLGTAFSFMGS
ncbi:unnamed protein product, partial [Candidula unifasciata]